MADATFPFIRCYVGHLLGCDRGACPLIVFVYIVLLQQQQRVQPGSLHFNLVHMKPEIIVVRCLRRPRCGCLWHYGAADAACCD